MDIDEALVELKSENNIRFTRLLTITEKFFGKPRNRGTSHYPFKTPWQGKGGKAKPYQVKQVKEALIKLKEIQENKNNE
jgi:hypothetical protein